MSDNNLTEKELRIRLYENYDWPVYFDLLLAIVEGGEKLMKLRKKCKLYLEDLQTQMNNYYALPSDKRIQFLGQLEKRNFDPTPKQIVEEEQEIEVKERQRIKKLMESVSR